MATAADKRPVVAAIPPLTTRGMAAPAETAAMQPIKAIIAKAVKTTPVICRALVIFGCWSENERFGCRGNV